MSIIGRKIRLCRLFIMLVLVLSAGPLFAQQRTHYLNTVSLPLPAKTVETDQKETPSAVGIAALPKRKMTLAEIGTCATHNHPGVQQAQRQAEALRGAWIQAGLKPNPSLEYSVEDMTQDSAGLQCVTFSQPITLKYKINARQSAINREYQAALHDVKILSQKAVNDAKLAAYRVAFAYQKCLILEELTRLSQEAQQAGDELFRAREIGRVDQLDISIQTDRTHIALRDGEIAYRTACIALTVLLALPTEELIEIADQVETLPPELDKSMLFAQVRAACPEAQQAHAEVEAAHARLKQQCAEAGIDFGANARIAYNTETKQNEFSVGVAIPLRLFDRNQGNIKQAQSELAAAYRNVERLERFHALEFETHWGKYQTARNRVIFYKEKILSKARESLDLALTAYRRGEYSSLELLDSQRTFSTVHIEYLDNLNMLMELHVMLQGNFLTGGLKKPGTE